MNYQKIKIFVDKIKVSEPESVRIQCHEVDEDVRELVAYVKSRQGKLTGRLDGETFEIYVKDILYVEAVDNRRFIYTTSKAYETGAKIYELEEQLKQQRFLRISKSVIVNLMKISSIRPSLNGRFIAKLSNGEEIIISRKYVPDLKRTLKGGEAK